MSAPLTAIHAIPDDLRERDQWGLWLRENGTKVPYAVRGCRASSTNPRTWATFDETVRALSRQPGRWAGLAWFFSSDDSLCGIDIDNCLTEDGTPKSWAQGMIERFADTYMEISPSGRGIKLWCRGKLPRNLGKVKIEDGGIEMYTHSRFFTVTGRPFRGSPSQIEDHSQDILRLYNGLAPAPGRWQHNPEASGKIPYGRQHFTLTSIAGTLARRNVCIEAIEACLQTINERQCERPGTSENISRIARSALVWIARQHREAS